MSRFHRSEILLGAENLTKIQNSHILIAGLGAVGSYAIEALARIGILNFTLVDFDIIQESNMNRNILAKDSTLGLNKVDAAKDHIMDINPHCHIHTINTFLDDTTISQILTPLNLNEQKTHPLDIIIDAIDSVGPKTELLKIAYQKKIPIISCMGAASRRDFKQILVDDISKTETCPLARQIRRQLKKFDIYGGIKVVYSKEPQPQDSFEKTTIDDRIIKRGRIRNTLGSLSTLPGIFGLIAAHEAIEFLLKKQSE